MNTTEQVRVIVIKLISDWVGFVSAEIFSEAYNAGAASIDEQMNDLAALHPRWSADENTIQRWTKENAHLNDEDNDPLFEKWEQIESLFSAWRGMQSSKRTLDTVINSVPSIWGPLAALSSDGFVPREIRRLLLS